MNPSQLLHLTPSAAAAMTPQQRGALDSAQQRAVDEAYEGKSDSKSKSNAKMIYSKHVNFIIVTSLTLIKIEKKFITLK